MSAVPSHIYLRFFARGPHLTTYNIYKRPPSLVVKVRQSPPLPRRRAHYEAHTLRKINAKMLWMFESVVVILDVVYIHICYARRLLTDIAFVWRTRPVCG